MTDLIKREDALAAIYEDSPEWTREAIAALPAIDPADRIEALVEERDGYLAERNKFKLYLQRTHADLELEVAAVDALNAKLAKAVEYFKKLDRRGDALETFDPVVHEIVTAALADLVGEG